jgi:hypothetical protein
VLFVNVHNKEITDRFSSGEHDTASGAMPKRARHQGMLLTLPAHQHTLSRSAEDDSFSALKCFSNGNDRLPAEAQGDIVSRRPEISFKCSWYHWYAVCLMLVGRC